MVKSFFDTAFRKSMFDPMAEPYLASLCSHSIDHSYERENGLLSQWRAYGGAERFCIVFDTTGLSHLLNDEYLSHYWLYLRLDRVHYAIPDIKIDNIFPDLLTYFERYMKTHFKTGKPRVFEELFVGFVSAASRFKHQGFKEEQEVRIIAIPHKPAMIDRAQRHNPERTLLPLKAVHERSSDLEKKIPYLSLFEQLGQELPIKRIIIGPSRDQTEDLAHARQLVGDQYPLHLSETPFIG